MAIKAKGTLIYADKRGMFFKISVLSVLLRPDKIWS